MEEGSRLTRAHSRTGHLMDMCVYIFVKTRDYGDSAEDDDADAR